MSLAISNPVRWQRPFSLFAPHAFDPTADRTAIPLPARVRIGVA